MLLFCRWLLDLWEDWGWAAWGDWLGVFCMGKAPFILGCPTPGAGLVGGMLLFTVIAKGAMPCALLSGETIVQIKKNIKILDGKCFTDIFKNLYILITNGNWIDTNI